MAYLAGLSGHEFWDAMISFCAATHFGSGRKFQLRGPADKDESVGPAVDQVGAKVECEHQMFPLPSTTA